MSLMIEAKVLNKEVDFQTGDSRDPGAIEMIHEYRNHPRHLRTSSGAMLDGITLSRKDIIDLLKRNQDGDIEEGPDIMLIFAVSYYDLMNGSIPQNDKGFTVILASIKNDGTEEGKVDKGLLMNKYKPCPDDCAKFREVFP